MLARKHTLGTLILTGFGAGAVAYVRTTAMRSRDAARIALRPTTIVRGRFEKSHVRNVCAARASTMHGLPVDLVPGLLDALQWRVGDLAACCRVCRVWRELATPKLYHRLWLRDHTRVIRVFATLAAHPELARLVRIIGVYLVLCRTSCLSVWAAGGASRGVGRADSHDAPPRDRPAGAVLDTRWQLERPPAAHHV